MSSEPKIPRPPRPSSPEAAELRRQQEDHEHKVATDIKAIAHHMVRREQRDAERDQALVIMADELGCAAKLPPSLRASIRPPPLEHDGRAAKKPDHVPVHENVQKSAQVSGRTLVVLFLLVLLQAFEILNAILKGHV